MPKTVAAFAGFAPSGLKFLADLKKHNDRDWFNSRKQLFEDQVRQPMLELVAALHHKMLKFAPEYVADPAKALYRIYRDVRFSKNKAPYKTHMAALFWRNSLGKDDGAAFFFSISPESVEIAGGIYMPSPEILLAVRNHVADNADEFRKVLKRSAVKKLLGDLHGESVSRMPKGFAPDHKEAILIRMKQFVLGTSLPGTVASTPALFTELVSRLEALAPFIDFLNTPLLSRKRADRSGDFFD